MTKLNLVIFIILILSIAYVYLRIPASTNGNISGTISGTDSESLTQKYPLLARRILQENPNDVIINFLPLRTKLREQVKDWADSFGFYFEYLPTGTSIGVNEKNEFGGASLLKIPIVMAYYNALEKGVTLPEKAVIKKEHIFAEYGDLWKEEGKEVSLERAAALSLTDSDNTAVEVLLDYIDREHFMDVYEGLDIPFRLEENTIYVGPKSYSSILKALYFGAVLSLENSQRILKLLTETKFNDKLPAPLPKDVVVAHKIGDYHHEVYQDCGIVYLPKRQYILCMFSKSGEDEARRRMQLISKLTYEYVRDANAAKLISP